MTILRTDRNQVFDGRGNLVAETVVSVDVTAGAVQLDLHARARQAIVDNQAFLALASPTNAQTLAQVKRLTRECSALIRLLLAVDGSPDLLVQSTDV